MLGLETPEGLASYFWCGEASKAEKYSGRSCSTMYNNARGRSAILDQAHSHTRQWQHGRSEEAS